MAKGTGKSGVEVAQEHVDALIDYLERNRGKPLPRYGVDLNRSLIAKECGFDRQVFRSNPRCAEILKGEEEHLTTFRLPKPGYTSDNLIASGWRPRKLARPRCLNRARSCLSWLHLLRSWSLRSTQSGSIGNIIVERMFEFGTKGDRHSTFRVHAFGRVKGVAHAGSCRVEQ